MVQIIITFTTFIRYYGSVLCCSAVSSTMTVRTPYACGSFKSKLKFIEIAFSNLHSPGTTEARTRSAPFFLGRFSYVGPGGNGH